MHIIPLDDIDEDGAAVKLRSLHSPPAAHEVRAGRSLHPASVVASLVLDLRPSLGTRWQGPALDRCYCWPSTSSSVLLGCALARACTVQCVQVSALGVCFCRPGTSSLKRFLGASVTDC